VARVRRVRTVEGFGVRRRVAVQRPGAVSRLRASGAAAVLLTALIGLGTPPATARAAGASEARSVTPTNLSGVVTPAAVAPITVLPGGGNLAASMGGVTPLLQPYTPPASVTEVPSLRTQNSRTLANPDGTFTSQTSAGPINYKDSAGAWQPINLAVLPSAEGAYSLKVAAAQNTVRLGTSNGSLAQVDTGSHVATLTATSATLGTAGSGLDANEISFAPSGAGPSVWVRPVDVGVEFGATWASALGSPTAAYTLDAGDLTAALAKDGSTVELRDGGGLLIGAIAAPVMREKDMDGAPLLGHVQVALVPSGKTTYSLTYTVDTAWLSAPDRVFPVILDPTWCMGDGSDSQGCTHYDNSGDDDTFIFSATPSSYEVGWTTMRVGYDVRSDDGDVYDTMRGFTHFGPVTLPDGAVIYDTDLQLHIGSEYGGPSGETIWAYRATKSWAYPITWSNHSTGYTTTNGASTTVPTSGYMHWDVDQIVKAWNTHRPADYLTDYGIVMKMGSEGSSHGEVEFSRYTNSNADYRPLLTISYSVPLGTIDFDPRLGTMYAPSQMVAGVATKLPVVVGNKTGSGSNFLTCASSPNDCWKVGYRWFDAKGNLYSGGTPTETTDLPAAVNAGGSPSAPFPVLVTPPSTTGQYTLRLDLVHVYYGFYSWASDYATTSKYYARNKKLLSPSSTRWTGTSAIERDEFGISVVSGTGGGNTRTVNTDTGGQLGIDLFSKNLALTQDSGLSFADRLRLSLQYGYNSALSTTCPNYQGILAACGWWTNFDERIVGGVNQTGFDYIYQGPDGTQTMMDTDSDGQIVGGASVLINRPRFTILDENGGGDGSDSDSSVDLPAYDPTPDGFSAFSGTLVGKAPSTLSTNLQTRDKVDLNTYQMARFAVRTSAAASSGLCFQIHNVANSATYPDRWFCYTVGTTWTTGFDQLPLNLQSGVAHLYSGWNYYTTNLYSDVTSFGTHFGALYDDLQVVGFSVQSAPSSSGSTYVDAFRLETTDNVLLDDTNPSNWTNGQTQTSDQTADVFTGAKAIKVTPPATSTNPWPECKTSNSCWSSTAPGLWTNAFVDWYWKKAGGTTAGMVFYVKDQTTGASACSTSDCALIYYAGAAPAANVTGNKVVGLQLSATLPTTWTNVRRNLLEDARQSFGLYADSGDGSPDDLKVTGYAVLAGDGSYLLVDRFAYGNLADVSAIDPTGPDSSGVAGEQNRPNAAGDGTFTYDFSADYPDGSRHYFNRDGLLTRIRDRDGQSITLDWTYDTTRWGPSAYTLTTIHAPSDGTSSGGTTFDRQFTVSRGTDGSLKTVRFDEVLGTTSSDVSTRAVVFEVSDPPADSQTGGPTTATSSVPRAWLGNTFYAKARSTVTINGTLSGSTPRSVGFMCPDSGPQDTSQLNPGAGPWTFTLPGNAEAGCRAYLWTSGASATITGWTVSYADAGGDVMKVSQARHVVASGATGAFCSGRPSGCIEYGYTDGTSHRLEIVASPRWDGSGSGSADAQLEVGRDTNNAPISILDDSHSGAALLNVIKFDDTRDGTLLYNRPLWQDAAAGAANAFLAADLGPDGQLLAEYAPRLCPGGNCAWTNLPAANTEGSYTRLAREFDGVQRVTSVTEYRCPSANDAVNGCTGTTALLTTSRYGTNSGAKIDNYADPLAGGRLAWAATADQVFASLRDSGGTNPDLYRTDFNYDGSGQISETVEARQLDNSNYADVIKANSPTGFWRLNETSGTSMADSSGNSRGGTYSGTPSLGVTGIIVRDPANKAMTLNGTSQYGSVTAATMGTVGTNFTVEGWVKPTDPTAVIVWAGSRNVAGGSSFEFKGGNTLHGVIGDGTNSTINADATFNYQTGVWYDVAYVITPNSYRIYVNGQLVDGGYFATSTPVLTNSTHAFYIGQNGASTYWKGSIDDVAVYPAALSAYDIAAHYRAGRAIATVDTTALRDNQGRLLESEAQFVANPGFENGSSGWTLGSGAVIGAGGNNGSASSLTLATAATTQVDQLVPGQTVRLQFWTQTSSGAAPAEAKLEYWSTAGTPSWQTLGGFDYTFPDTSWTGHAYDVMLPMTTDGRIRLSLSRTGSGTASADDVIAVLDWTKTVYDTATLGLGHGLATDGYTLNSCASAPCTAPTVHTQLTYLAGTASPNWYPAIFPTASIANYMDGLPGPGADTDVKTTVAYDAWGRVTSTTDADGVATTSTYDFANNQTDVINAKDAQRNVAIAYDAVGNVWKTTTQSGGVTTNAYDYLNRLVTTAAPDGTIARTDYNNFGQATATWANYVSGSPGTDHDLLTTLTYDQFGRVVQKDVECGSTGACSTGGLDARTTTTFDVLGNALTSTTYPSTAGGGTARATTGYFETWSLGGSNPTYSRRVASGTQLPIAPAGSPALLCPGSASAYCNQVNTLDLGDRAVQSTDAYGVITKTSLDVDARPVQVVANYTTAADDGLNDQNIATQTIYDALGHPVVLYDALNRSETRAYDALGRVVEDDHFGTDAAQYASLSTTYTPAGRTAAVNDGASTTATVYDTDGRPVRTIVNVDPSGNAGMTLDAFETGTDGWSFTPSGYFTTGTAAFSLEQDAAGNEYTSVAPVSGRGRLHITTDAVNTVDGAWLNVSGATYQSGHVYKVAFDAQVQAGVSVRVFFGQDASGGNNAELSGGITGDGAWHRYSFTWTPSASVSTLVHFAIRRDTAGTADAYLDNLVIWDTTTGSTDKGIVSSETIYDGDGQALGTVLPPGDPSTEEPVVTTVARSIVGRPVVAVENGSSGAYSSTVRTTSGLLAYFPLDERAGTNAADTQSVSTLGATGAMTLGVAGGIDEARTAMRFAGGYLSKSANVTSATGTVAMSAWIRADGAPSGTNTVIVASNGTSSNSWGLGITPSGDAAAFAQKSNNPNSGFWTIDATGVVVTDGAWHHLVLSRNASTWTLAVDGQNKTVTNSTKDPGTPGAGFSIGAWSDGSRTFTGEIDEVSVYNANIGTSGASTLYAAGRRSDSATALTTRTAYDGLGRATDVWAPDLIRTHLAYDRLGNPTDVWANYRNGTTTTATGDTDVHSSFASDVLGELAGYCPAREVFIGGCTASDPAESQAWHYAYDAMGRQITVKSPDTTTVAKLDMNETVYDSGGRVTKTCVYPAYPTLGSCTGTTTTRHTDMAYDALGRNRTASVYDRTSGSDVLKFTRTQTWNKDSTIASVAESSDTLSYFYDPAGRLNAFKRGSTTLTAFVYNSTTGTLSTRTDGTLGTTTFGYDWAKRVTSVLMPSTYFSGTVTRTYRLDGTPLTQTFPSSLTETVAYDAVKRPTSIALGSGQSLSQAYDRASRVSSEARVLTGISGDAGSNTQTFTYDGLSRVIGSSGLGQTNTYTYDLDGNRLTRASSGVTTTYTYDRTDELINQVISGTTKSFAYDAYGNMTTAADSASSLTTYAYDEENRLTTITPPSGSAATFVLDALGRNKTRTVGASVDTYGYVGPSEMTYETGNTTTDAILDPAGVRLAVKTGGVVSFVLSDLHGSTSALTASGSTSVTDAYRFDPYGQTEASAGTTSNPWKYRGSLDISPTSTPLYDMQARNYSPQLGAFTQEDTVVGGPTSPLTMNRFLYAGADPATNVDPTGHTYCTLTNYPECDGFKPGTTQDQINAMEDAYTCRILPKSCDEPAPVKPTYSGGDGTGGGGSGSGTGSNSGSGSGSGASKSPLAPPDSSNVRVPAGVPIYGGCKAVELGTGLGLDIVGGVLEIGAVVIDFGSGLFGTPLAIAIFVAGAADTYEGTRRIYEACSGF